MWMLVRADALDCYWDDADGHRVLAACPDTDERGDPWRWSARLEGTGPDAVVGIEADPEFIAVSSTLYSDGFSGTVERSSGHQLVITALAGQVLVAAAEGPWERWLSPGDVFIAEGEDDETLRISLDRDGTRVSAISLAPKRAAALRWVP